MKCPKLVRLLKKYLDNPPLVMDKKDAIYIIEHYDSKLFSDGYRDHNNTSDGFLYDEIDKSYMIKIDFLNSDKTINFSEFCEINVKEHNNNRVNFRNPQMLHNINGKTYYFNVQFIRMKFNLYNNYKSVYDKYSVRNTLLTTLKNKLPPPIV